MKRVTIFLLAVLPTIIAAAAPARVERLYRYWNLDPALTDQFFPIAATLSRYPLPADRPEIRVVEPQFFVDSGECTPADGKGCIIYGLYNIDPSQPDVIFLNQAIPPELRAATLVHEITHWLQERAGRRNLNCEQAATVELEAYAVEYRYLIEQTPFKHPPIYVPDLSCK